MCPYLLISQHFNILKIQPFKNISTHFPHDHPWGHMRHSYKISYFTQRQHASAMQSAVCAVTIHQNTICNMSSSHFHQVRKVITCHMSHVACMLCVSTEQIEHRAKVGPLYHMLAENKYSLHTSSGGNPAHPLSSSCN